MRRLCVSYSRPIRFVKFEGMSGNLRLPVLDPPRVKSGPLKMIAFGKFSRDGNGC